MSAGRPGWEGHAGLGSGMWGPSVKINKGQTHSMLTQFNEFFFFLKLLPLPVVHILKLKGVWENLCNFER